MPNLHLAQKFDGISFVENIGRMKENFRTISDDAVRDGSEVVALQMLQDNRQFRDGSDFDFEVSRKRRFLPLLGKLVRIDTRVFLVSPLRRIARSFQLNLSSSRDWS